MDDWEYARLVWVEGEGFYRYEPGKEPLGPIQSFMLLEVILDELEMAGWTQVGGMLTLSAFSSPGYGPPPEDLVFRRERDSQAKGGTT